MSDFNEKNYNDFLRKSFRVSEVCAFLGITPRILKHYETMGILSPSREHANDYRSYSAEEIIKIQTAEQLKKMGFSMREIKDYFSGDLEMKAFRTRLFAQKKMLERLLDLTDTEIHAGIPKYEIEESCEKLCYVKTYPYILDIQHMYLDARETYMSAIKAGCKAYGAETFFLEMPYKKFFTVRTRLENNQPNAYEYNPVYRICVPILSAPPALFCDGSVETVIRKRALVLKIADIPPGGGKLFILLKEEAKRRGLTLTGKAWTASETGPNKKTAKQNYTMIAAVEIE